MATTAATVWGWRKCDLGGEAGGRKGFVGSFCINAEEGRNGADLTVFARRPPLVSLHYFWAKMKRLGAQFHGCHGHDSSTRGVNWDINKITIGHGMYTLHWRQWNATLREARTQHWRQTGSVGEWICDRKTAFIDKVSLIARQTDTTAKCRPRNNNIGLTVCITYSSSGEVQTELVRKGYASVPSPSQTSSQRWAKLYIETLLLRQSLCRQIKFPKKTWDLSCLN